MSLLQPVFPWSPKCASTTGKLPADFATSFMLLRCNTYDHSHPEMFAASHSVILRPVLWRARINDPYGSLLTQDILWCNNSNLVLLHMYIRCVEISNLAIWSLTLLLMYTLRSWASELLHTLISFFFFSFFFWSYHLCLPMAVNNSNKVYLKL